MAPCHEGAAARRWPGAPRNDVISRLLLQLTHAGTSQERWLYLPHGAAVPEAASDLGSATSVLQGDLFMSARPVVIAKDVKKSFQHMGRTLDVLRGIDLTINEGEMVGIVGQSGACLLYTSRCV